MISGSVSLRPQPRRGLIFIYEPSRPLAPTIVKNSTSSARRRSTPPSSRSPPCCSSPPRPAPSPATSRAARCANTERRDGVRNRQRSRVRAATGLRPPPQAAEGRGRGQRYLEPYRPHRLASAGRWGCLFCAIAVAPSSPTCFVQGIKFLKPSMLVTRPPPASRKANPAASPTP